MTAAVKLALVEVRRSPGMVLRVERLITDPAFTPRQLGRRPRSRQGVR